MKKSLTCLIASVLCMGALSSCGNIDIQKIASAIVDEGNSESSAAPSSNEPSASSADSSAVVPSSASSVDSSSSSIVPQTNDIEISFWHTFGKTLIDAIQKKIDAYQSLVKKNEGVNVKITMRYQGSYDDINDKIGKGFSTSNIPTIAVAYPDHVADYLQAEGNNPGKYVVKLDSYMNDDKIGFGKETYLSDEFGAADFVDAYLEEGQQYIREGTYSLPFLKSSEVMFYNIEGVKKAMAFYNPEIASNEAKIEQFLKTMTWDQFMDLCTSVKEHKSQIISALEVPAFYDSDSNLFISKMYQNGIPYSHVVENGYGYIDFKDEPYLTQAKTMVQGLKASYDAGLITTKGAFGTYGSNNFLQQKTLFSIGSTGGAGYNFPSSEDFHVGVCRVPASNNNPIYVSQGPTLCLLKNPTDSDTLTASKVKYAWKFLKYITNAEINTSICFDGSEGYMPVRKSAYETDLFLDFMENDDEYSHTADVIINDIGNRFFNTAVFKGSTVLRDEVGGLIGDVFAGSKTIDECFKDAIDHTVLAME